MSEVFLKLFNTSITAGWLILAVAVIRLLFKKAPKGLNVFLWGLVALRLVFPFSIESVLSLIPSPETVPEAIITDYTFSVSSGIQPIDNALNHVLSNRFHEGVTVPTNTGKNLLTIMGVIWIAGVIIMLLYSLISFIKIRRKVSASIKLTDNVFICDEINSPFILGIIRPKIYLSSSLSDCERDFIIAHEKEHLKHLDYLWKPIGFLLLSVYWFNPLLWLSYILLCKDIELACDERVIKKMDREYIADYSQTLLKFSSNRRMIISCPVAFGEVSIKERVKSVLNYKKPALWVIIVSVIICIVISVCFFTNKPTDKNPEQAPLSTISKTGLDGVSVEIAELVTEGENRHITIRFLNYSKYDISYGEQFDIIDLESGKSIFGDEERCFNMPAYFIKQGKVAEQEYPLDGAAFRRDGEFRFETSFSKESNEITQKDYQAEITFRLSDYVSVIKLTASDGLNSEFTYYPVSLSKETKAPTSFCVLYFTITEKTENGYKVKVTDISDHNREFDEFEITNGKAKKLTLSDNTVVTFELINNMISGIYSVSESVAESYYISSTYIDIGATIIIDDIFQATNCFNTIIGNFPFEADRTSVSLGTLSKSANYDQIIDYLENYLYWNDKKLPKQIRKNTVEAWESNEAYFLVQNNGDIYYFEIHRKNSDDGNWHDDLNTLFTPHLLLLKRNNELTDDLSVDVKRAEFKSEKPIENDFDSMATLTLFNNNTFQLIGQVYSNYIEYGTYFEEDGKIYLRNDNGLLYVFRITDENELEFIEKKSKKYPGFDFLKNEFRFIME